MDAFEFPAHADFVNRERDLARMEDWWQGPDRNALALFGRRRVGKSWLFRRFAHGKPALVLVADKRAKGAQLRRFSDRLEPLLGVRPDLQDLPALFEALYRLALPDRLLVIIDEFPYLLPARAREQQAELTAVQAAMEERDAAQLKLVLCGSHIAQMQTLLGQESPLRGRLTPLPINPLTFAEAQEFLPTDLDQRDRVERFAVGGGMTLYLDGVGRGAGSLRKRVCDSVLDSRGPLFNDPREVLEEELRQPGVYFSLLEELSGGERNTADLARALRTRTKDLSPYLKVLRDMQVVERIAPIDAGRDFRDYRYRIEDNFMRFWFRFVFPFQDDLRSGLLPQNLYDGEIEPVLSEHIAPVFEKLCREWTRRALGPQASRVGVWWGRATAANRRSGERQSEEVDVVGTQRSRVTVVGECKWTAARLSIKVLKDLEDHKIPAMVQSGLKLAAPGPLIVLFSKTGFKDNLVEEAVHREDVRLVDLSELVAGSTGDRTAPATDT
jgi:uncharacterized protein